MLINVNFNGSVNSNRLENKNLRKNLPFRTNSYPSDSVSFSGREDLSFQLAMETITRIITRTFGKKDDLLANLVYNHLKTETFPGNTFMIRVSEDNFFNEVISGAMKNASASEKENLLTKLFEIQMALCEKYKSTPRSTVKKLSAIRKQFQELYQTRGVQFRGGMVERVSEKIEEAFQKTSGAKDLRDIMGSDIDCELFTRLCEKSKEYRDCFGNKSDPMDSIHCMYDRKNVVSFLHSTLPDLIKEEKNPLRLEDLWLKNLFVIREWNGGSTRASEIENLLEMKSYLYKQADFAGIDFKHKAEVDRELNQLMNMFVFGRFNISELKTPEETVDLMTRVLKSFHYKDDIRPKDVKKEKVIDALMSMGKDSKDEKYYKSALNLLDRDTENDYARILIERILKDENITPEYRKALENTSETYKSKVGNLVSETAAKFEAGTYEEAFNVLQSNPNIMNAIEKWEKERNLTKEQILENLRRCDFLTTANIIRETAWATEPNSKTYDDMIHFLGKIDNLVENPDELERLKNMRIALLGTKIYKLKSTDADLANAYYKILKTDLRNMLYGERNNNELVTKSEVNEEVIERIAEEFSQIIYFPLMPTTSVFGCIDTVISRELEFLRHGPQAQAWARVNNHTLLSDKALDELLLKRKEINSRLNIDINDKYFEEYINRCRNNQSITSNLSKNSAIDILNKYLPEEEKLQQDAEFSDIKKAYISLAKKYHPDKDTSDARKAEKTEIFMEIGKAYEALTKKNK